MFNGNKTRRLKQLMLIAFVALMAAFWLAVLWFAVYRNHRLSLHRRGGDHLATVGR